MGERKLRGVHCDLSIVNDVSPILLQREYFERIQRILHIMSSLECRLIFSDGALIPSDPTFSFHGTDHIATLFIFVGWWKRAIVKNRVLNNVSGEDIYRYPVTSDVWIAKYRKINQKEKSAFQLLMDTSPRSLKKFISIGNCRDI